MKKILLLFFILFVKCFELQAIIVVQGKVVDEKGEPVPLLIVRLYDDSRLKAFTKTNKEGRFKFSLDSLSQPTELHFLSSKYEEKIETISDFQKDYLVTLSPAVHKLEEFVVKVPRVRVKGDTLTYDVASHTNIGDRNIEDVIRKLPGIEITEQGTILYDGEPINNFYIEDLNLLGNNYSLASRNIRPEDISTLSIYQHHQPTKALKDVRFSRSAALNLKLKKSRMIKPIGYVEGGVGWGEDLLWTGSLYTMFISPRNQTIIQAEGNNTADIYSVLTPNSSKLTRMFLNEPFGQPRLPFIRYAFNKSGNTSANTLVKLPRELTLTLNTSYNLDHYDFSGRTRTTYLLPENENYVVAENVVNNPRQHDVKTSLKVEKNSSTLFLSDVVAFEGNFRNNDYRITSNDELIKQSLSSDNYNFSNILKAILNRNGKIFNISSETFFNNIPPLSMIAQKNGDNLLLSQRVEGSSFKNNESFYFSFPLGSKHRLTLNSGLFLDIDKLFSQKEEEQLLSPGNNLKGIAGGLNFTVEYTFSIKRVGNFSLSVPLKWEQRKYSDEAGKSIYNKGVFYPNLNMAVFLKLRRYSLFTINGNMETRYGDLYNFATQPIMLTYRSSRTLGNGGLNKNQEKRVRVAYRFNQVFRGLYFRTNFSYSQRKSNVMAMSDINDMESSVGLVNRHSRSSQYDLKCTFSKSFISCNTTLSSEVDGGLNKASTLRDMNTVTAKNLFLDAGIKAETEQFNGFIRVMAKGSMRHTRQTFSGNIPRNRITDYNAEGKIIIAPVKKIEIFGLFDFQRSNIAEGVYKNAAFIDAGIRYKNKAIEVELTGKNLTNVSEYSYSIYHDLNIITSSYRLRPIEFCMNLRYKF